MADISNSLLAQAVDAIFAADAALSAVISENAILTSQVEALRGAPDRSEEVANLQIERDALRAERDLLKTKIEHVTAVLAG